MKNASHPKVILITGAAQGIGRATAIQLLNEGHIVYGGDINFDAMQDMEALGMKRLRWDVTCENDAKEAAERVFGEQGRIDVLFANAGYTCVGVFELVNTEEAKRQIDVNLFGVAHAIRAVLPYMRQAAPQGSGRIIITSSAASKIAPPGFSWYPASKHAVEGLAFSLRREMKYCFPGIKVIVVRPGFIATNMYESSYRSWQKAMEHPLAEVYKTAMNQLINGFKTGFKNGATPTTISKVISKAISAKRPKKVYMTNADAVLSVAAATLFNNTDFIDNQLIKQIFPKTKLP